MLSCPLQVVPAWKITEVYKLSILDGREDYRLSILDGREDYRLSILGGREDYRLSILGGRITERLHTGSWQYIEAFDNISSIKVSYMRVRILA